MTDLFLTARDPHNTMALHVEVYGSAESADLYATSLELNAKHFDGKLSACFIEIASPASPNAYATHQPKTPEGVACMIRIAPSVVADSKAFAHDVLLHEMIHVWQAETDNREPGYAGHGPKFAAKCNEIGARLGLPEVGVRGKDGKPDCAQWPLNVRPAGYYGEGKKAAKAVVKATRTKGSKRATTRANEPSKVEQAIALFASMTAEETEATLQLLGLKPCPENLTKGYALYMLSRP